MRDAPDPNQKVALVTGASRGIGRAIALELAQADYYLIVNYRSDDAGAARTLDEIRAGGGAGEAVRFDVADPSAAKAAMDDLVNRFERIDALVNNAGVVADGLFLMMPERDWNRVVDTTLKGFYHVTKPVIKKMVRRKQGVIVSISSAAGMMGNRGQANYSAAKAGLIGASRALAAEVARLGIRVNVVAPGLIETDMIENAPVAQIKQMIPMARIGKPVEVARVVRFLCSEDASYMTGQVVSVNGGMY